MKSMTGFGKAIRETKAYQLDIEIKSVNQRFLDVQIRSPKILNFIENDFRQLIKQQLSRGRIEVFVNLAHIGKNEKQIVINWELIDSTYHPIDRRDSTTIRESKSSVNSSAGGTLRAG